MMSYNQEIEVRGPVGTSRLEYFYRRVSVIFKKASKHAPPPVEVSSGCKKRGFGLALGYAVSHLVSTITT